VDRDEALARLGLAEDQPAAYREPSIRLDRERRARADGRQLTQMGHSHVGHLSVMIFACSWTVSARWRGGTAALADHPLSLTEKHKHVLLEIGHSGGTDFRLGALVGSRELQELERAGYVWRDLITVREPGPGMTETAVWYLTDLGAAAVGIDPVRIYRR
jgi:hypothetical protein